MLLHFSFICLYELLKKTPRKRPCREKNFLPFSSGLDSEANSITEEEVDEISVGIQNKLTYKMRDEMKKPENTILKALNSELANSLKSTMSKRRLTLCLERQYNLGQSLSYRSDSDQEKVDPLGIFNATQTHMTPKQLTFTTGD